MIVTFGEILLRFSTLNQNRIAQTETYSAVYGGSEANVAVSLANFGHQVSYITRLPDNDLTETIFELFKKYNIDMQHTLLGGSRLGLYFLETGAGHRQAKVLYDRMFSAISEIKPGMIDWDKAFANASWFHFSGITPAISQSAADTCLEGLEIATKKGLSISVDLNFRSKLWNYGKSPAQIMPNLLKHCHYIFGGIDAPEKMLGMSDVKINPSVPLTQADIVAISNQMLDAYPAAKLFGSTLRWVKTCDHHQLQGVIFGRDSQQLYQSPIYEIPQMVERIGGGDAFMAGLIHGLINFSQDYDKVVKFATAASTLKHYINGDFNLSTCQEVTSLMRGTGLFIHR